MHFFSCVTHIYVGQSVQVKMPQQNEDLKVQVMSYKIFRNLHKDSHKKKTITILPPLEESHVKDGCVCIHELQQEGLEDEALFKVGFCFWNL